MDQSFKQPNQSLRATQNDEEDLKLVLQQKQREDGQEEVNKEQMLPSLIVSPGKLDQLVVSPVIQETYDPFDKVETINIEES